MSAPAVTITTFAAAVAAGVALTVRRGSGRSTDKATPRPSGGHIGSAGAAPRSRSSSPAASLQWLSPATGTFSSAGRRELQRLAS